MTAGMKMVMIAYNEAVDMEVMEALERYRANSYTKIAGAYGKGAASGTHLGNDIWPGLNNIIYIACDAKQAREILSCVMELRKTLGREGVKAFALPVEELT